MEEAANDAILVFNPALENYRNVNLYRGERERMKVWLRPSGKIVTFSQLR
jgi:hypothetical protein